MNKYVYVLLLYIVFACGCSGSVSPVIDVRNSFKSGDMDKVKSFLGHKDPYARIEALESLIKAGECTSEIYGLHSDSNAKVREALANELLKCNTSESMHVLQVMLEDENALVRKSAVGSAIANNSCRSECNFKIRNLLNDSDVYVKFQAAKALRQRFPDEAHEAILDCLFSDITFLQIEAIKALPEFGHRGDVYLLGELLDSDDPMVRAAAAKSIQGILGFAPTGETYLRIVNKQPLDGLDRTSHEQKKSEKINIMARFNASYDPDLKEFGIYKQSKIDRNAVAVIIGNKNYTSIDIPDVEYANRDSVLMKTVAKKVFGVSEENIIYIEDAKTSDFNKVFGTNLNYRGQLNNWASSRSNIYIYYSGHGAPDVNSGKSYIVPVDADIEFIEFSGYPLELLYRNLSEINAKNIYVIIEACFSGATQAGTIVKNASPVILKVDQTNYAKNHNNFIVFNSSGPDQISTWNDSKKHGLFSYYFVKGLGEGDRNKDGILTAEELGCYLRHKVEDEARRIMNRSQTPIIQGDKNIQVLNNVF